MLLGIMAATATVGIAAGAGGNAARLEALSKEAAAIGGLFLFQARNNCKLGIGAAVSANPAEVCAHGRGFALIFNGNFSGPGIAVLSIGAMGVNHVTTPHTAADRLCSAAEAEEDRVSKEPDPNACRGHG
jgi:hypothetical protein